MVEAFMFEQQKLPKSTGTWSASLWANAVLTRSLEVIFFSLKQDCMPAALRAGSVLQILIHIINDD
jgi:hypothetical protein